MVNYYYDGTFDGLLTSVYESYYGIEPPDKILRCKNLQQSILDKDIDIVTDSEKASKVYEAIHKKISYDALRNVYHAYLSELDEIDTYIYQYLRFGFKKGKSVDLYLTSEEVLKVHSAAKKVRTESHLMLGLLRFRKLNGGLYYAPYSPVYNITALISDHFVRRLSDQFWIIHDTKRNLAAVYNMVECVLTDLPEELQHQSLNTDDCFEDLWKKYFDSICIKDRINPKLQKRNMPARYWKYLVEKQ
ncbi:TIGR03915 family putative DNA repair protein [Acetivibrio mesophilus]|uniref:DNA metabolism protein n=1 Tax=Acetivibrio mesophilus TaxID=2487273 RepID=A0A4V1K2H6_9FIRM|nr:TIGR03915 family putative DNA repair protein [Acetivibrio mesophilus]ODM25735.1 DNA metabolism protein [Clostridium sp. Bc-iso-3]RXE60319.1 DNA metabolism protein [Acetivibrio mesophilus]HHV30444.1 DNA metabolism protein [Clostridium sp.]